MQTESRLYWELKTQVEKKLSFLSEAAYLDLTHPSESPWIFKKKKKKKHLLIWLQQVLVAAHGILDLHCSLKDFQLQPVESSGI